MIYILNIISKPHADVQIVTKTYLKFQKNCHKPVLIDFLLTVKAVTFKGTATLVISMFYQKELYEP